MHEIQPRSETYLGQISNKGLQVARNSAKYELVVRLTLVEVRAKGLKLHEIQPSSETYLGQISNKGLEVARNQMASRFRTNGFKFELRTNGSKVEFRTNGFNQPKVEFRTNGFNQPKVEFRTNGFNQPEVEFVEGRSVWIPLGKGA